MLLEYFNLTTSKSSSLRFLFPHSSSFSPLPISSSYPLPYLVLVPLISPFLYFSYSHLFSFHYGLILLLLLLLKSTIFFIYFSSVTLFFLLLLLFMFSSLNLPTHCLVFLLILYNPSSSSTFYSLSLLSLDASVITQNIDTAQCPPSVSPPPVKGLSGN